VDQSRQPSLPERKDRAVVYAHSTKFIRQPRGFEDRFGPSNTPIQSPKRCNTPQEVTSTNRKTTRAISFQVMANTRHCYHNLCPESHLPSTTAEANRSWFRHAPIFTNTFNMLHKSYHRYCSGIARGSTNHDNHPNHFFRIPAHARLASCPMLHCHGYTVTQNTHHSIRHRKLIFSWSVRVRHGKPIVVGCGSIHHLPRGRLLRNAHDVRNPPRPSNHTARQRYTHRAKASHDSA